MFIGWKLWESYWRMGWRAAEVMAYRIPLMTQMSAQQPHAWKQRDVTELNGMVWEKMEAASAAMLAMWQHFWKLAWMWPYGYSQGAQDGLHRAVLQPYNRQLSKNLKRIRARS